MDIDLKTFNFKELREYLYEYTLKKTKNYHLFHYTSLEALTNILKTNTLWATHCKYLNDLMELRDFERLYNKLINTEDKKFNEYVKSFKEVMFKDLFEKLIEKTFIISFSKDNDIIPMWKNYGKNGVVIEFDTSIMVNTVRFDEVNILDRDNKIQKITTVKRYGEAMYEDTQIIKIFKLSFQLFSRLSELNNPDKENEISNAIIEELHNLFYGAFFQKKENNFKYENEYRMAFSLEDKDVGNIENFRIKNNLVIPYIAVEFKHNGKIPIKSITINPEQKDCMYEESIKYLLKSYNYDIQINHSGSKLR
jgi:hypothetical protein